MAALKVPSGLFRPLAAFYAVVVCAVFYRYLVLGELLFQARELCLNS